MSTQDKEWLKEFSFTEEGSIDWSKRPFSKSWSLQRLGFSGVKELVASYIPIKSKCFLISSELIIEEPHTTISKALDEVKHQEKQTGHFWFTNPGGRWILEISKEQMFSLEILNRKNPNLVKYYQTPKEDLH